jgi:flavin reductase (DIM6/NTAB) family NADH-FMN oxidoreductase RutF
MTAPTIDDFVNRLDDSLVVVTTASDDQRAGCVVGFHSQCSIEPARYAVWLSKANLTYRVALFASHIAVHVITDADRPLFELFGGTSGDRTEKFALCEWSVGPGGVPLLDECPSRMVLEVTSRLDDGSDHVCFVGVPVEIEVGPPSTPMRLSSSASTAAGHEPTERTTPSELTASEPGAEHRDAMDDARRRELENAAAGAGHAVDLGAIDRQDDEPDRRGTS